MGKLYGWLMGSSAYEKGYPGYPGIPLGVGLKIVSDLIPVGEKILS